MISDARRAASRRNGRLSKGPRSPQGRAISRGNAVKHGLGIGIRADPVWSWEMTRLARMLKAHLQGAVSKEEADEVAAAMVALMRSATARTQVWDLAIHLVQAVTEPTQDSSHAQDRDEDLGLDLQALSEVIERLATMERYERQAQLACWRKLAALEDLQVVRGKISQSG